MSDFILKLFPVVQTNSDKSGLIKNHLVRDNFLTGEEFDFYGEAFLRPGAAFCDYFLFDDERSARQTYKKDARIKIVSDGYGVVMEEEAEEPEFFGRKNVLEIWNIDGNYNNWDKLIHSLQQITGDVYKGEWEIL